MSDIILKTRKFLKSFWAILSLQQELVGKMLTLSYRRDASVENQSELNNNNK